MPTYRFRYVCESSLIFEHDVPFESSGQEVVFLSSEQNTRNTVRARVDVKGQNYREANVNAQSVVQPVLDAVSFSTGTPLLVQHWDFVIKSEPGSATRTALWCDFRKEPAPHPVTRDEIDETRHVLGQAGESLELCWHRYAIQRNLVIDRFVFQWLAFEALAGKASIPTICPRCRKEISHCDLPLSHEGSDREKAYELFSRTNADVSNAEFTREIWGKARNSVFHGNKYPNPQLLRHLMTLSPKLRDACESEFKNRLNLRDQRPRVHDIEFHVYRYNMFEWNTANVQDEFASDFPWNAVRQHLGDQQPDEIRVGFPETWPFKLLNFARDSETW